MLQTNEIPILEYDTDVNAVIMPNHEKLDLKLPERCVFAFLDGLVDSFAKENSCAILSHFESSTKIYPVYKFERDGVPFCFSQAPVGAAAAVQFLDWLIGYGVKEVVAVGGCGTLVGFPENIFLLPTRALRDEGTSYHYLPASRYVDLNGLAVSSVAQTLRKNNIPFTECLTWTTDGFFRETKELVKYRRSEGCSAVEMECSALAACAQFRRVLFAELLFTGDTLADPDKYNERSWGKDSHKKAFQLAIDSVINMC